MLLGNPFSDEAVVSENREECVVVPKLREFLCVAGKLLEDGEGRLFCVRVVYEDVDIIGDVCEGTAMVL